MVSSLQRTILLAAPPQDPDAVQATSPTHRGRQMKSEPVYKPELPVPHEAHSAFDFTLCLVGQDLKGATSQSVLGRAAVESYVITMVAGAL